MRSALLLGCLVVAPACGDDGGNTAIDAPVVVSDDNTIDTMPDGMADTIVGTGLCLDEACTQISTDAKEYVPQYELWSDAATKRRWIQLPAGTQIDTSDMDYWKFPIGTKIWKEFSRGGTRVETRYITKLADELEPAPAVSWFYISYQWNADQTGTTAITTGAMDANGTEHDIPSRSQCRQCHDFGLKGPLRDRGRVLGVGAMSLDYEAPQGFLDLADLVAANQLTVAPTAPAAAGQPYFPFPTGTTTQDKAAFGYLHANCGHCHNPTSNVSSGGIDVALRLDTTLLAMRTKIPAYDTTVNVAATKPLNDGFTGSIVVPDDATSSILIRRMISFAPGDHMPALGSADVDPTGQTVLVDWINSLP